MTDLALAIATTGSRSRSSSPTRGGLPRHGYRSRPTCRDRRSNGFRTTSSTSWTPTNPSRSPIGRASARPDPRDRVTWAAAAARRGSGLYVSASSTATTTPPSPGLPSSGSAWRTSSRRGLGQSSHGCVQRTRPRPQRSTCAIRDGCCGRSSAPSRQGRGPNGEPVRREGRARRARTARTVLYPRIDERARELFDVGLLDEVRELRAAGYGPSCGR
jgi:hypothetical protein